MTNQEQAPVSYGLTTEKARELQERFGKNELTPQKRQSFFSKILHTASEPMFLLLLIAAAIYFFLGEPRDGAIMLIFVVGIIGIDVIQERKTDKTLEALKDLSAPRVRVIRDGEEKTISSADLVPGDLMLIAEGVKIPADGEVVRASDLCVDESSLTGEAEGVWKVVADSAEKQPDTWRRDYCYAGTLVLQGSALVRVGKIGAATEYGKIGTNVANAPENPTPLQKQTGRLVQLCAGIAAVLFVLVGCATWLNIPDHSFRDRLIESILSGVTLAMAMIPEEFPVILTVFLSMGAWRLAKKQSLVRKLPAVETLGAVSVLCVDKTGTITMNKMAVRETWAVDGDEKHLGEIMGMACETEAYDPMEQAMFAHCESLGITRGQLFSGELVREYPFTNEAKMMGHVWKREERIIVAAKGSPEKILRLCALTDAEGDAVQAKSGGMSRQGLRVIAVGETELPFGDSIPETLPDCRLRLRGLVGLADPPRASVREDIRCCTQAGVRVVMITGDNGITASSIARQVGIPNCEKIITGDELDRMTDEELREKVRSVSIFSRVVPEHKMRIVKAFRENGEVVAMTGDGVNDAPALKYADIGISMGKRGSEVSREAADLILLDDNFSTIVETIRDGRRIYDNIKKAVGYVFAIHIPIAFSCLLAPMLGVNPASLMLLPLHVVLLELIIDPTCSIVLERQPAERDIMARLPRDPSEKIINAAGLIKSLLQGFAVFAASFGTYFSVLQMDPQNNAPVARAMGLTVIFLSNLLLVLVNSSHTDFAFRSLARLVKDKVMWAIFAGTILGLLLILYTPLAGFLKLAPLNGPEFLTVMGISAVAVLWFELVKLGRCLKRK
ncbi:cation-translocating P-type ATPase [Caproiciproducens sp. NJN-50]|uniref:cation-translocating P-type ATPase n=1 Tax=Acutalibacteraceae TaxID=3082771 RepID=UPI000FFE2EF5|nr:MULTISPECIES: cation-translocating P-type ATPase [Acutalibacteraceae]QAT50436.1 cation-translocating P-type ATPase [Caproiciproducens sp. NJN-50]